MKYSQRALKSSDTFLGIPRRSQACVEKTQEDPKLSPLADLNALCKQEVEVKAVLYTYTQSLRKDQEIYQLKALVVQSLADH